jgi:hypothetical protein
MTEPEWSALLRAARPADAAGRVPCLDAETLVALASGSLAESQRDAALEHVGTCADCGDALRVALDARGFADALAAEIAAERKPAARPQARRTMRLPGFALAASVLLAVGAVSLMLRTPAPDAIRGTSVAALDPTDGARLDAAPARLAWACVAAAPVRVEVLDATGAPAWQADVDGCDVELPPAARAVIGSGDWLWRVRARDGTALAGPWRFRID